MRTWSWIVLGAMGCSGQGTWTLETWGEDFIVSGIPAGEFEDGCSVTYDRFLVVLRDVSLVDDAQAPVATLGGAFAFDLVEGGPLVVGETQAPSGTWRGMQVSIAPDAEAVPPEGGEDLVALLDSRQASVIAQGQVTCGDRTVGFDWSFDTATRYACDPENLVIPPGGDGRTQLTIHGDHLFYDSLTAEDAVLRGQALVDADADEDGVLTEAELRAAPVAPTGYTTGSFAEVTDLWAYLRVQVTSLGHVDGEGHCGVEVL